MNKRDREVLYTKLFYLAEKAEYCRDRDRLIILAQFMGACKLAVAIERNGNAGSDEAARELYDKIRREVQHSIQVRDKIADEVEARIRQHSRETQ